MEKVTYFAWLLISLLSMTEAFKLLKPTVVTSSARFVSMAAREPTKEELLKAVSTNIPKGSTVVIKYGTATNIESFLHPSYFVPPQLPVNLIFVF